jgi:pilus assembly protein Flp/PilA
LDRYKQPDQEKTTMKSLKNALIALWNDEEGLTTVEYALAGGLIAVAVSLAFTNLGNAVRDVINNITAIITPGA